MFQHLFHRTKSPQPRFAQSIFLLLLAFFIAILNVRPILALAGMGTTLIIAASLVELNRDRIWLDYKKAYKKQKGLKGVFTKPNEIYYTLNIVFLWPFIAFIGIICIYASYAYVS